MQRILIFFLLTLFFMLIIKLNLFKICVIQQQVPLPLPCVNFAQIAAPSLTLDNAIF
jgi:hypothetical protein